NPHFKRIVDYRDVESHNMYAELRAQGRDSDNLLAILASKSRDNSRTPMQWDDGENAGFTHGTPWINLCDNYQTINAKTAVDDPNSVFYAYQQLIKLRKANPVFTWGNYQDLLPEHPYLWCYRREWQGQTLIVAANLSRENQWWMPEAFDGKWDVLMSNYSDAASKPGEISLRPFEAVYWLQG
ncbi:MAG TPA: DUF3459 domain-containing protein, partial [Buttiauxella sp.]